MEKPSEGGSYLRQPDGSLKRAVKAPEPAPPQETSKPTRAPRGTTAKDK